MSKGTDATLVGAVIGTIVGVAPRVYDRITGKRHEDADTASLVGAGAGSVTAAAMALLDQVQEERTTCRAALTAANERIDAGDLERTDLRRQIADLRSEVATLRRNGFEIVSATAMVATPEAAAAIAKRGNTTYRCQVQQAGSGTCTWPTCGCGDA